MGQEFRLINIEETKNYFLEKIDQNESMTRNKNIRELSWMCNGVMRFGLLLNFLFILASFDILASLSISHVFSSDFSGR